MHSTNECMGVLCFCLLVLRAWRVFFSKSASNTVGPLFFHEKRLEYTAFFAHSTRKMADFSGVFFVLFRKIQRLEEQGYLSTRRVCPRGPKAIKYKHQ